MEEFTRTTKPGCQKRKMKLGVSSKVHNLFPVKPASRPEISGLKPRFRVGDVTNITCQLFNTFPSANITWFVSGQKVNNLKKRRSRFEEKELGKVPKDSEKLLLCRKLFFKLLSASPPSLIRLNEFVCVTLRSFAIITFSFSFFFHISYTRIARLKRVPLA